MDAKDTSQDQVPPLPQTPQGVNDTLSSVVLTVGASPASDASTPNASPLLKLSHRLDAAINTFNAKFDAHDKKFDEVLSLLNRLCAGNNASSPPRTPTTASRGGIAQVSQDGNDSNVGGGTNQTPQGSNSDGSVKTNDVPHSTFVAPSYQERKLSLLESHLLTSKEQLDLQSATNAQLKDAIDIQSSFQDQLYSLCADGFKEISESSLSAFKQQQAMMQQQQVVMTSQPLGVEDFGDTSKSTFPTLKQLQTWVTTMDTRLFEFDSTTVHLPESVKATQKNIHFQYSKAFNKVVLQSILQHYWTTNSLPCDSYVPFPKLFKFIKDTYLVGGVAPVTLDVGTALQRVVDNVGLLKLSPETPTLAQLTTFQTCCMLEFQTVLRLPTLAATYAWLDKNPQPLKNFIRGFDTVIGHPVARTIFNTQVLEDFEHDWSLATVSKMFRNFHHAVVAADKYLYAHQPELLTNLKPLLTPTAIHQFDPQGDATSYDDASTLSDFDDIDGEDIYSLDTGDSVDADSPGVAPVEVDGDPPALSTDDATASDLVALNVDGEIAYFQRYRGDKAPRKKPFRRGGYDVPRGYSQPAPQPSRTLDAPPRTSPFRSSIQDLMQAVLQELKKLNRLSSDNSSSRDRAPSSRGQPAGVTPRRPFVPKERHATRPVRTRPPASGGRRY